MIDFKSPSYCDAYSRVNALVIVGEALADRHFRSLARLIPDDEEHLLRLAAMEGRHTVDFSSCGRNLGVKPSMATGKSLFAPLERLFRALENSRDVVGCLVLQGLIVECFAVAAYRAYLPVADPYARAITVTVIDDETKHLNYAECWLQAKGQQIHSQIVSICEKALPLTLSILKAMKSDLSAIGIDSTDLLAFFCEDFTQALFSVGIPLADAQRLLIKAAAVED